MKHQGWYGAWLLLGVTAVAGATLAVALHNVHQGLMGSGRCWPRQ